MSYASFGSNLPAILHLNIDSLQVAIDLFDKRVFQYIENDLFITNYSKQKAGELHLKAIEDIYNIQKIKNLL